MREGGEAQFREVIWSTKVWRPEMENHIIPKKEGERITATYIFSCTCCG